MGLLEFHSIERVRIEWVSHDLRVQKREAEVQTRYGPSVSLALRRVMGQISQSYKEIMLDFFLLID